MLCPWESWTANNCFLIVTLPWSSGMPAPFATQAKSSRDVPCVDCVCLLGLAKQLKSIGGRACPGFKLGVRECCDHLHLPVPVRQWRNVTTTTNTLWLHHRNRRVLHLSLPTCDGRVGGESRSASASVSISRDLQLPLAPLLDAFRLANKFPSDII